MNRDIEAEFAPCCRICLSSDNHRGCFGAVHELISPCRCKGSQQFVHRSCLDQWRAIKAIGGIGGVAFSLDRNGKFRNKFTDKWDWMLSKHPLPFYYCVGVAVFFALVGLFGLLSHCISCDYSDDDPSCLPEPECSYRCLHHEASSSRSGLRSGDDDDCVFVVIVVVVLVFALLGVVFGFIAATMAFQKIMQRHYHILKKKKADKGVRGGRTLKRAT